MQILRDRLQYTIHRNLCDFLLATTSVGYGFEVAPFEARTNEQCAIWALPYDVNCSEQGQLLDVVSWIGHC